MRKGLLLAAVAAFSVLALAPVAAASDPVETAPGAVVRVFVLKHKRVEEAALLIRPHLSESASITLAPRLNAMTVTDRDENVRVVGKVLADFDVPPRGFTFAV